MKCTLAASGAIVIASLATLSLLFTGYGHDVVSLVATRTGISMPHEKLGWLDEAEPSSSDRHRLAEITGSGYDSDVSAIRASVGGARGDLTRDDFELLHQDRRRARAAYPDVAEDELYVVTWFRVGFSDRVPKTFCTSGNRNGTKGADGKWYLDGGCYLSVVRPQYGKRADAAMTKTVLADLADRMRRKRTAHLERWGYNFVENLTDGGVVSSLGVYAYPDPLPSDTESDSRHVAGKAVIVLDRRDRYEFSFDAADWLDPPYTREGLMRLATAKGAVRSDYKPAPEKRRVRTDGLLARGQSCTSGRLCWSIWNAEKDDYVNTDIGPADPASWVLEPFTSSFLPAGDNGDRRSDPDKPWYVVVTFYGYPTTASGGWTEQEAKAALPDFFTGLSFPINDDRANRGNLQEARATQIPPADVQMLVDHACPTKPKKVNDPNHVSYSPGMTLAPGQSTTVP